MNHGGIGYPLVGILNWLAPGAIIRLKTPSPVQHRQRGSSMTVYTMEVFTCRLTAAG